MNRLFDNWKAVAGFVVSYRKLCLLAAILFCWGELSGCMVLFGDPNKLYIKIKTKPEHCQVVLRSLNTSEISSYTSPVELGYRYTPFMATFIEISYEGYVTEKIKLDPDNTDLLIELRPLTEEELMEMKTKAAKSMGPGSHGEIGGGSPEMEISNTGGDMPNLGTGMGGFGESAF